MFCRCCITVKRYQLLRERVRYLVSLRFEPRQPQKITLGLREAFTKRYIVERINEAEIRPEEQSEKAESCRDNLWNEIRLKSHKDRNGHKNIIKTSGQARLVYVFDINRNIPTTWRWARGDWRGRALQTPAKKIDTVPFFSPPSFDVSCCLRVKVGFVLFCFVFWWVKIRMMTYKVRGLSVWNLGWRGNQGFFCWYARSEVASHMPRVGQNIALHASPVARQSVLLISALPVRLTSFIPGPVEHSETCVVTLASNQTCDLMFSFVVSC